MSVQTLYLDMVIAAFGLFAIVLLGASLWTKTGVGKGRRNP
jgi:hypothetical protein